MRIGGRPCGSRLAPSVHFPLRRTRPPGPAVPSSGLAQGRRTLRCHLYAGGGEKYVEPRAGRRVRLALLLTGALLAALPAAGAAAQTPAAGPDATAGSAATQTPVDPTIPTPTSAAPDGGSTPAGADGCGSDSIGWGGSDDFDVAVPFSPQNGVNFQGAVQVWDLDGSQQVDGLGVWTGNGNQEQVYVPINLQDGHTYGWDASTYNGTAYSEPTAPCYFKVDASRPTVPSITDPDFPPAGGPGTPTKSSGQPTTFVLSGGHDNLPSGCTVANTPDCSVSGLVAYEYSLDTPLGIGSPQVPVDSNGDAGVTFTPTWGTHTLYVNAIDAAGNLAVSAASYTFYVPWELQSPTTVTLTVPKTGVRGGPLRVAGHLTPGSYGPNETVQLTRTDLAHPVPVVVAAGQVSSGGSFAFTDTPQIGGTNTYTVAYAGDATRAPATASASVQVSRAAPVLSIVGNASVYAYGGWAKLTAHLGPTYNGRSVSIYAQPYGGSRQLVKTGTVDRNGNLTVWYRPSRTTWISAVFAGDYRYAPADTGRFIFDQVAIGTAQHGYASTVRGTQERVYHHTVRPVITAVVTPGKRGQCVYFTVQEYYSGAWHNVLLSGCERLNASSVATDVLSLRNATGHLFRVTAEYVHSSTDPSYADTHSAWQYFSVEK